jgi:hypothetical protein
MAITAQVGTGTITSTEGTAEEVQATIAALDASSKEAPPPADGEKPSQTVDLDVQITDEVVTTKPAPAIVQDRESDGKFKAGGKKDAQSRIAHVTWEREEARRQAAAAQQRAEQFERELAEYRKNGASGAQEPAPARTARTPSDGRPSEDEVGTTYQTYADYVEAVADWKVEQRFKAQQAQVHQTEAEREYAETAQAYTAKKEAWRQQHPAQAAEFDSLVQAAGGSTKTPKLPPVMGYAILHSDHGPAVEHYLLSHPEECLQLIEDASDLPATPRAAQWVRRALESKIAQAAPPGPAPAITRQPVPAPIQPVGASPVVSEVDTSTLRGKAYVDAENAKELARIRRQRGML